jgi:hypothetical protein
MHDLYMRKVAVGQDHLLDPMTLYDLRKLLLRKDGNSPGVPGAGELGREKPVLDPRNLGRGEGHDLKGRIVAEADLKVMEVSPGSAHDDHSGSFHCLSFLWPGNENILLQKETPDKTLKPVLYLLAL